LALITIMASLAAITGFGSIWLLYQTATQQEEIRLTEIVQSRARLMEAVARFDARHSSDHPGGSKLATISQIKDAHKDFSGFGKSGEFTLAEKVDNSIVFILRQRHNNTETPKPISFSSNLAEPMRRALSGKSGIVIGPDYRGVEVMAAHEPVELLNMGIVAKIDLAEIRSPFIKATLYWIVFAFGLVVIAVFVFYKVGSPILNAIQQSEKKLGLQVNCINKLQHQFIEATHPDKLFNNLLEEVLKITDSAYGFVDEVMVDKKGDAYLQALAVSNIAWNDKLQKFQSDNTPPGLILQQMHGLYAEQFKTGIAYIANDPKTNVDKNDLAQGQSSLKNFLGLPLKIDDKVVAIIGLANRSTGYDQPLIDFLEPVTLACARVIENYRNQLKMLDAKDALKASEDRFRSLVESTSDWIWEMDTNANFKYVSPRVKDILGYEPDELIGKMTGFDIMPEAEADKIRSEYAAFVAEAQPFSGLININIHKNGQQRVMESSGSPFFDKEGKILGYRGIDRDITRRIEQELTFKEVEQRQRLILNAAGDGIYGLDINGLTTFVNPAAAKMVGWKQEELIGLSQHDILHHKHADGSHYPKEDCPIYASLKDGVSQNVKHEVFWRKDGTSFPVEYITTPIIEEEKIVGAVVLFKDITKSKKIEKRLRELTEAVEQSPASVVITDVDGNIQYVNPHFCKLTGYTYQESIGISPSILKSGEMPDEEYKVLWETITSGKTWHGEFHNKKKNGELYWESASISPIRDSDNKIINFLAIKEDITKRKIIEEELKLSKEEAERANESKSMFLASMSHDIRTPMNAILGMGEILAESNLDNEQKHYLKIINSAGEGLLALINDILDLSKIEAGELELETVPFSPRELVNESIIILKTKALSQGIKLHSNIAETTPDHLIGDPQRLKQILLNLLSNALKFTERGKVILSVTKAQNSFLRLSVSDTGTGIAKERLETIFKPFKQAETSTTRRFGGTGLGLSICQKLVTLMEGKIWVESTMGKGSTFNFEIPIQLVEEIKDQHNLDADSGTTANSDEKGLSILLADDAEENCFVIEAFLKNSNHTLTTVADGSEAFETFKQGDFDIVLMDINMPVMDGYEATKKIREWENSQQRSPIPILALTANAMKEDVEKTREAGCNLHLSKPLRKQRLIEAINIFS
ncbi:MAG: PAS domain S-box protein, partial [Magnetococcales bacterium]|nr:PAS domain S-box protein [Magnetococcales bacterium]